MRLRMIRLSITSRTMAPIPIINVAVVDITIRITTIIKVTRWLLC